MAKTRTDNFAKDMRRVLQDKCGLKWEIGKPVKGDRECADVIGREKDGEDGRRGKDCVLIEVELRRGTPLGNSVKVWNEISREKAGKGRLGTRVILFQVFSSFYRKKGKKGTRQLNAEFIGEQMALACRPRVRYIPLNMKYSPGKRLTGRSATRGGGARKKQAVKLAHRIIDRLRKIGV